MINRLRLLPAAIILLGIVLISGCTTQENIHEPDIHPPAENIEYVGGKYELELVITEVTANDKTAVMKKIRYVKDGKVIEPNQILPDNMRPGLDWLKANTPENSIVMSWWDYGNAIRAYSEREPVIDTPSKALLSTTVSKYLGKPLEDIECDACLPHNVVEDVARLLISEDAIEAKMLMEKYRARYLYVHIEDERKSMAFYIARGLEPEPIEDTILFRALDGQEIEGFELVYSDGVSMIYELTK
ncbi:MAG: hypothetical protein KAJ91_00970 [Candidatus Aenigmarchaeota archaeon]|nr:hypothetical protein [Candidatus Aenigmarchaeota archaeon]